LPLDPLLVDETQIGFVHELGGLQSGRNAHGSKTGPLKIGTHRRRKGSAG
jgi:hypothetical protein